MIGGAFGSQTFHDEQTELVLVITPKLVADVTAARDALDELRKKMPMLDRIFPKSNNPANFPAEGKPEAKPEPKAEGNPPPAK